MTDYTEIFSQLGPAENTTANEAKQRFLTCAQAGFLQHAIDASLGGHGDSFHHLSQTHELLGEHTQDTGLVLALNAHIWGAIFPLFRFGDDEQKAVFLPSLLNGNIIAGHAITEPDAGSDTQAMQTCAVETPDGYQLTGHKRFITNTPIADMLIVYAKLNDVITAFIIRSDDTGATFCDGPTVSGCATATMGDIVLQDCLVPKNRLLGKPGAGGMMIQLAMELERAFIFAGVAGIMQWQLDQVVEYVKDRKIGDQSLSKKQAVSHRIADMKLRLDTTRMWVQQCAQQCDQHNRITVSSAQTKLYASEAFLQSSLDAVHLCGSHGMTGKLSTLVQDAMAGRLFSGTSEIQKNIIAGMMGL